MKTQNEVVTGNDVSVAEPEAFEEEPRPSDTEPEIDRRSARRFVIGSVILVLLIVAAGWWWQARKYEETDDAQVDGNIYPISARISGQLSAVNVEEGQFVKAGTILAEIDSKDHEIAEERARAEYDDAFAEARAANSLVPVTRVGSSSEISTAQAEMARAQTQVTVAVKNVEQQRAKLVDAKAMAMTVNADLRRYSDLISKHEISQQEYDRAIAAADAANANVSGVEAAVISAEEQVNQARERVKESAANLENAQISPKNVSVVAARAKAAEAKVSRAHAALERAELDLSYTKIVAPVDGIIGRRAAQVGQNVQPGQDLVAVVPLNDVWITANYKEDQLALMRPGQDASIEVDTYGRKWHGKVTSIGGATGARYSLLPPENATGNYVKVVQRIPVRIDLTRDANKQGLLRPGMSVVPRVRVR